MFTYLVLAHKDNNRICPSGEEMVLDTSGCCPKYVTQCTGECAELTCPTFHNLVVEELQEGECCPKKRCGEF